MRATKSIMTVLLVYKLSIFSSLSQHITTVIYKTHPVVNSTSEIYKYGVLDELALPVDTLATFSFKRKLFDRPTSLEALFGIAETEARKLGGNIIKVTSYDDDRKL